MSMALAGMPAVAGRGTALAVGVGNFDGESAVALGVTHTTKRAVFKIGVTHTEKAEQYQGRIQGLMIHTLSC